MHFNFDPVPRGYMNARREFLTRSSVPEKKAEKNMTA